MKHSVIIPAHNEEDCVGETLRALLKTLTPLGFDFEIIVVADHCSDGTERVVQDIATDDSRVRTRVNPRRPGFGMALRAGLDVYQGDSATFYMADASDSPEDLARYWRELENGAECVFGSRFIKGGRAIDYPTHKLILNRLVNGWIRLLFRHGLNDTTNAFKAYRREAIEGCRPILSPHFNITVELPLKAVIRGYQYKIVPISWRNRVTGVSKLKIKEMGSRYLFIIMYCYLEKLFSMGDYERDRRAEDNQSETES